MRGTDLSKIEGLLTELDGALFSVRQRLRDVDKGKTKEDISKRSKLGEYNRLL